jgi:hypothetical protein
MTELVTSEEVLEIRRSITKNGLFDLHQFANIIVLRALERLTSNPRTETDKKHEN